MEEPKQEENGLWSVGEQWFATKEQAENYIARAQRREYLSRAYSVPKKRGKFLGYGKFELAFSIIGALIVIFLFRSCSGADDSASSAGASMQSTYASAQKTYTPVQLKEMVRSGSYPKQGSASSKTQDLDYVSCIRKIESIVDSIKINYPTQSVVSTNVLRIEKIWTNDAAMTLTCSATDKRLVITTASYL